MMSDVNDAETIELAERLIKFTEQHGISRRDFLRVLGTGAGAAAAVSILAACGPTSSAQPTPAANTAAPAPPNQLPR
jgi:hypothetical protein